MTAVLGIWLSWILFNKLKFSRFAIFLYSLFITIHPALPLLAAGPAITPSNFSARPTLFLFEFRKTEMEHIVFGIWFPIILSRLLSGDFWVFYLGILIHALIRKYFNRSYLLKPLIINTIILFFHLFSGALPAPLRPTSQQRLPENFGCIFNGSELFWLFKDCDHKCIFTGGVAASWLARQGSPYVALFPRLPLLAFFIFKW